MGDFDPQGKTILGICAHPDDLDFGCSATFAKWVNLGAKAYYLILTDGSKGYEDCNFPNNELVGIRRKEQSAAGDIIGLSDIFFLDFVDGELENNNTLKKEIVRVIRDIKPDAVFTIDPTLVYDSSEGFINHPDHRVAGQATLDAIFPFARNPRTYPELIQEGCHCHNVSNVFLINFQNLNFYVDVTETLDQKLRALKQHVSQHEDKEYYQTMLKERAEKIGKEAGYKYAEGFIRIKIAN